MSLETDTPNTIWQALKKDHLEDAEFAAYRPMQQMTASVLGVSPSFYPLACTSKAAIHTHIGLFGKSFHMPQVDMGLSTMTPTLRRTAFLCSSVTFDCSYCTAHACAVGDVFRGSMEEQIRRGASAPVDCLDPDAPNISAATSATIRLAKASSVRHFIPSASAISPLKDAVAQELGSAGLEAVMTTICFTGCLNTFMDVLGAELETDVGRFASSHLAAVGISYEEGIHKSTEESETSEELKPYGQVLGSIANGLRLVSSIPYFVRGMMLERRLYVGIPSSDDGLDSWVLEHLGYIPSFLENINGTDFKRAVCFGLRENLLPDGNDNGNEVRVWGRDDRCALMYTYGSVVGCHELMELADHLKISVTLVDLKRFADRTQEGTWSDSCWDARQVVLDQSIKAENVSQGTIRQITNSCQTEGIIELVGLLSFFCFWYRLERLFGTRSECSTSSGN